jgi:hypothetical protein
VADKAEQVRQMSVTRRALVNGFIKQCVVLKLTFRSSGKVPELEELQPLPCHLAEE